MALTLCGLKKRSLLERAQTLQPNCPGLHPGSLTDKLCNIELLFILSFLVSKTEIDNTTFMEL